MSEMLTDEETLVLRDAKARAEARGHCSCDACLHQLEVSRRLADALRAWQEWAALLLKVLKEPPTHSDLESRDVIGDLVVAMASDEIDGLEDACRRIGKRLVKL